MLYGKRKRSDILIPLKRDQTFYVMRSIVYQEIIIIQTRVNQHIISVAKNESMKLLTITPVGHRVKLTIISQELMK